MTTSKTIGRYDAPEYIEPIKEMFKENFPDNVPKDFIIDHVIKYFWKYVEQQIKDDKQVSVFSYGKFYLREAASRTTKETQFYPKFKFSRHFNLRLRDAKGTTTEAEKKEIEAKRQFQQGVWRKRKAHMLATRGYIPEKLQGYD